MELEKIPKRLKLAWIIPQLKPGHNKNPPSSFRPISQTSLLIRGNERTIKRYLQSHLDVNNLIGDFQYGFRPKRSCLAQLLIFYNDILKNLEDGNNQDVLYLDFRKAFDVVDIGLLCHRLKEKGINGLMGKWIHNFLTNRQQQVLVNDSLS